jgi:tetratricopeptide (TPR) repeat protein
MPARDALIVASAQYTDPLLCQLQAPKTDAAGLIEVLSNQEIGGFQTKALIDRPSYEIAAAIEEFFLDRQPDDLLLLYFSGHGIKDVDGRLYFATINTKRSLLLATSVPASMVNDAMLRSRSRREVLILDCCHSGAFARGMVAKSDSSVGTSDQFQGTGRIVLTASDATQYALEAEQATGSGVRSIFTDVLVSGLKTGDADTDFDGRITLDELFAYTEDKVLQRTPNQKPMKWALGVTGSMVIAQNKNPVIHPADLAPNLLEALDKDNLPSIRQAGVKELGKILGRQDRALALAAELKLNELVQDLARGILADKASRADTEQKRQAASDADRAARQESLRQATADRARVEQEQQQKALLEAARRAEHERQRQAAAEQARQAQEEQDRKAAAEKARLEAAENARRDQEVKERKAAAEKARVAYEERLQKDAAEKALREKALREQELHVGIFSQALKNITVRARILAFAVVGVVLVLVLLWAASRNKAPQPNPEVDQTASNSQPSTNVPSSANAPATANQPPSPHASSSANAPALPHASSSANAPASPNANPAPSQYTASANTVVLPTETTNEFLPHIDKYRKQVQDNPKDPDARAWYGNALREAGQVDAAIEQFQASLKLPPKEIGRAFLYSNLAEAYEKKGDYDDALEAMKKSVASWPVKNEDVWCNDPFYRGAIGRILEKKGDYAGARDYWASLVPVAKDPAVCQKQADRLAAKIPQPANGNPKTKQY